jgi:hypothetical protein
MLRGRQSPEGEGPEGPKEPKSRRGAVEKKTKDTMKGQSKKRCETLTSFFSPAPTPVISSSPSFGQQPELEVGGTS